MQRALIALPTLLFACQAGPETQPLGTTSQDGTRLLVRYVEAEDGGAQRLLHLFDRELGQPCRLSTRPDGGETLTCLPAASGMVMFLDDACTTPYIATIHGEAGVVTASGFPPLAGPARLGARVADSGAARYLGGGDFGCSEAAALTDTPLYAVEAFLPLTELPQGRLVAEPLTEDLEAQVFEGDDGTRVLYYLVDRNTGGTCQPELTDAGPRCAGYVAEAHDEGLRNEACDRLVVAAYGQMQVATIPERGGATFRLTLMTAEDALTRVLGHGACEPEEHSIAGRRTLYFADPYPTSEWPAVELGTTSGRVLTARPGRIGELLLDTLTTVDPDTLFVDMSRNQDCGPAWVDGSLACVPAPAPNAHEYLTIYADPECTVPAAAVYSGSVPPATYTFRELGAPTSQEGLPTAKVYEVGAAVSTVYARDGLGACESAVYRHDYYRLDTPAPGPWPGLRLTSGS